MKVKVVASDSVLNEINLGNLIKSGQELEVTTSVIRGQLKNMGLNLFLGKIFTKTKILCFLVGCSRYICKGSTFICATYLLKPVMNILWRLTHP